MFWSWAFFLTLFFLQNFANTFTSRARNSASLWRHIKASLLSNGVWIAGQTLMLGSMFTYITGKHGLLLQIVATGAYTLVTTTGSIAAHYWALHSETGRSAVGASKLYAQVPVAEWAEVKEMLADYRNLQATLEASKGSQDAD